MRTLLAVAVLALAACSRPADDRVVVVPSEPPPAAKAPSAEETRRAKYEAERAAFFERREREKDYAEPDASVRELDFGAK